MRQNPARETGWIDWPILPNTIWHDTGEGGMWVYACWFVDYTQKITVPKYVEPMPDGEAQEYMIRDIDPFICCHGPANTLAMPMPEAVVSDILEAYDIEKMPKVGDPDYERRMLDTGRAGLLGAVCLGTTSVSYATINEGFHWQCTEDDLSAHGQSLVTSLSYLYDRKATLVTYLDT